MQPVLFVSSPSVETLLRRSNYSLRYRRKKESHAAAFVSRLMKSILRAGILLLPVLATPCFAQSKADLQTADDLVRRAQESWSSDPAGATKLYRQALGIRPNWAEGWLYLGGALYQSSRFAEAADALRKGVALAPGNGTGWAFLGLTEAALDNGEQALADIRKGEELGIGGSPEFEVAVRVTAARLLALTSAFDEALNQLQPLATKKQASPALIETMGLCALTESRSPANLTPQRRAVVNLAGQAAWSLVLQKPEEAEAGYKQLLEQYPNEPGVHYAHGLFLMETDLVAALAEFEKEAEIDPANWPARIVMAGLQIRQGSPDKALQTLRDTQKLMPAKYRWLCHAEMGRANMNAGNLDAAVKDLQTAVWLMPGNAQIHFLLAQTYRLAGRTADAQRESAEFAKWKAVQDPFGVPGLRTFGNATGRN
jgi:tetratricopeptide (TPR) repeat protein